jgi:hypothetical protein
MEGGKFKRKLSEVNTRAVSRRQNELVGKSTWKWVIRLVLYVTSVLSFPCGLFIRFVI